MDVKSFRRRFPPGRRVSKFAPYVKEIQSLRADGYTLKQVCAWLATEKLKVTVAALSVYLIRQERQSPHAKRSSRRSE
jgi:hypothetical protein